MATDIIKQIENVYLIKMQNMITETMSSFSKGGRIWQKKKEAIATDISDCFNHLIISDDVLKKSLKSDLQYWQFKNIQTEIIEELEKILSSEIDNVQKEQISCITELEKDITLLKQEFNQTEIFNYTIENNTSFVSNNYLEERLNFLRKILKNKIPDNFSLRQYDLLIKELTTQNILINDSIQRAKKDFEEKKLLLQKTYKIYDAIITLKYALSFYINPEIIFALGFVNSQLFSKSKKLQRIVLRHTQLFKDMIQELPYELKQYFSLIHLYEQAITTIEDEEEKQKIDPNIIIYQRIFDLGNIYFSQNQIEGLYLYNSDIFNRYWQMLRLIYKKTRLIYPDIISKEYSKTDIYINLTGNTNGAIAKIFNISESKFSRLKSNKQKITPQWALFLEKFLDFFSDFLKGTTTIPELGCSNEKYMLPVISLSRKTAPGILYAFKSYLNAVKQELNEQNINNNYSYLLEHINLIINNINNLNEDDFKAIDHLLFSKK